MDVFSLGSCDRRSAETEGECLVADKEVFIRLLCLIVAHLLPELAEAEASTSAKDPGVKFTIKTSVTHKN